MISNSWRSKLVNFARMPVADKSRAVQIKLKRVLNQMLPGVPIPVRLPPGLWWLAGDDACSDRIFLRRFEEDEQAFTRRYLKPGMNVLDIGAHHGLYALIASHRVGSSGKVVAFEPSARERARLERHLHLNRCDNVRVESFALGDHDHEAELFLINGRATGCNSLRPQGISERTWSQTVRVKTLDGYCHAEAIDRVDFIKIDVEGGELDVFRGAEQLLRRRPRPVILCEVSDRRTGSWGYSATKLIDYLSALDFAWFAIRDQGLLLPARFQEAVDGNFVAVPAECVDDVPRA